MTRFQKHNPMNKRDEIPQVVVNLYVKYHDGREKLIPCYSFAECMQHEMHLNGVAVTERRPLDNWKSVGAAAQNVIDGLSGKINE